MRKGLALGRRRLRRYLLLNAAAILGVAAAAAQGDIVVGSVTVPAPLSVTVGGQPPTGGAGTGTSPTSPYPIATPAPKPNALNGRAMWIWVLARSDGGDLSSIIADAHTYGIQTVLVKSSDGGQRWAQFNPGVVSALHAGGLKVCAWQYVYGNHPILEAQAGAAAVRDGADCLIIDAETEYQGKYVPAQTYLSKLRRMVGPNYPLALAGFPYLDYHPGFPYSVFLGPGGAQYNAPQMYWKDIGVGVDTVYAHTYLYNRLYGRPIYPLGQVYGSPPPAQIRRFRQLSRAYGAVGVSWWDWQEASGKGWRAVSQPVGSLSSFSADTSLASIHRDWQGDLVIWAQEHLRAAGQQLKVDGAFGPVTQAAVQNFQTAHGLSVTGTIDPPTWQALLRYAPAVVHWTVPRRGARTASVGGGTPVPASASLPAKRNEIPPRLGAG